MIVTIKRPNTEIYNAILGYIHRYHLEVGYMPTLREIVAGTDTHSTSQVNNYLKTARERGHIAMPLPMRARAYAFTVAGEFYVKAMGLEEEVREHV